MTPNEYVILRFLGQKDCATVRQIAGHLRNSLGYSKYLCDGMVNDDLLEECVDDSGKKPVPAYRLTPKSRAILADLLHGMEDNLRQRVARFRQVAAVVEERAHRLGEMAWRSTQPEAPTAGGKSLNQ
ncbi:MAG: winged helix-turn-helix transcriptional regulator [Candidatus Brocadiae bacterium]|nr:winged helix-turn-helix transcriptional regulator [Candidatus Brocadiia bacterium]